MNIIFLDLETTGLNVDKGDKIIEICCIKYQDNTKNIFHHYLNPETKISHESYLIHGIDNDFLKDKPLFKNICSSFINYIKNSKLIIHNAKFDLKFLNFQLKSLNLNTVDKYCYKIIDTLKFSRNFYKGKRNSLEFLCKKFKIYYNRKKHSALIDCKLLYYVYINLIFKIKKIKFLKKKRNIKKDFFYKDNVLKKSNKKENIFHNFILKFNKFNFF